MKRIAFGLSTSCFSTAFRRCSKSPRYLVPARSAPMSRAYTVHFASRSGTLPSTMRRANPSAIAVLPTPASPTSSGLFLRRRQSVCTTRSSSFSRPISGAIFLAENRHQHVRAGHLFFAGGLHVQDGALDHALEAERGLGVDLAVGGDARGLLGDVLRQVLAQLVHVGAAGAQHLGGRGVIEQREQQVLDGDELVAFLAGLHERHVQTDFEFLGDHSFSYLSAFLSAVKSLPGLSLPLSLF